MTKITPDAVEVENALQKLMMRLATTHDRTVSERERGAAAALRAGNGMATGYWRKIALAARAALSAQLEAAPQPASGDAEAMRQACIAEVRKEKPYEGADFPVCNSIIHGIEAIVLTPTEKPLDAPVVQRVDWLSVCRDYQKYALNGPWPGVSTPNYALAGAFQAIGDEIASLRLAALTAPVEPQPVSDGWTDQGKKWLAAGAPVGPEFKEWQKARVEPQPTNSLFDLLEALKPHFPEIAGGFARGTGGVEMEYILGVIRGKNRERLHPDSSLTLRQVMAGSEPLDWPGGDVERDAWYSGYDAAVAEYTRALSAAPAVGEGK